MINLPKEFTERMKKLLGDEYPLYEKALDNKPVKAFRINTDKISDAEFNKLNAFQCEKIPYVTNGYYINYEKIGNHPYHHAGMIYVQEPAAMVPAESIDINPDWCILDMCAAPGGKSTQLKNKLGEKGILVSNEIIPSRCKVLTGNIERLGLKNTVTTCMDTARLAKVFPQCFDLIMCDAPCSGEGMFRKEADALTMWSKENVLSCASRQKEILENASKLLKNGGYIIYATCTFSLEENEMVIDDFLSNHPEYEIIEATEKVRNFTSDGIVFDGAGCKNLNYARRCYPHKTKGEGQFVAVLHNTLKESTAKSHQREMTKLNIDGAVYEFLDNTLTDYDRDYVRMYKNNPVYFTPDFAVKDGTAFCCGVTIGEIKKNYIQPHHQFFMALGDKFKRKIQLSLEDERVKKYLHGEEITAQCENGWAVVTIDGCALGGAKVVNGVCKNHYPKGLRILK